MKFVVIFLALVAHSQAGVQVPRIHGERIINGQEAAVGEIPYQVSLQNYNGHFCGGSILNKHYVITAAHCVAMKSADTIKVIAGTTSLKDPQTVYSVIKRIIHDDFNSLRSNMNDIALLKIGAEFEFSKTISAVSLPKSGAKVAAGSAAVVSGWGDLWHGGETPDKLQRVDIEIADQSYCEQIHVSIIHSTQICAYDPKVVSGSCSGDSGGPLTVNGTLVGIVSWGIGCASVIYPTVYTRVPEYIDWINSHAV